MLLQTKQDKIQQTNCGKINTNQATVCVCVCAEGIWTTGERVWKMWLRSL